MQRLRSFRPAAPQAACLLLAACLAGGQARAQTALVNPDPLAPRLNTGPSTLPRFQKFGRSEAAPTDAPATFAQVFTAPPSGAGVTGFDAGNAPDRAAKAKQKSQSSAASRTPARLLGRALPSEPRPFGLGAPPAPAPSPYNQPQIVETPPASEANAALAAAPPGTPPASSPSPYNQPQIVETPPADEANTALAAAPPGTPSVPNIGPIRKKPKRKAHTEPEDPYAALGVRLGAFDLFPSVDLLGGYDTNPGQAHDHPKAAWLYSAQPELRVQSNWSRHELTADLRGTSTGYTPDQTPSLSRPYFNGKVDGRIDVTHDTRIELKGRGLVSTDSPDSPNVQAGLSVLPLFATVGQTLGIGHHFGRLDLLAKGDIARTVYQDSHFTDGTTASNKDREYKQYGGGLRAGYELFPGVTPFAEFSADERKYDLKADSFGYQRDSNGFVAKGGTSFKLRGSLTGEVSLGYTMRRYQDPRLSDVSGPVGEASLIWTASALTTVKLTGTTTVGESTVPGASGTLYRDVALQVDHAFRRWLVGTLKLGYGNDNYVGMSRDDNRYSLGFGLTYKVNRSLQIKGEIDQYWLRSNQSGNNYSDTLFLLGIHLQR